HARRLELLPYASGGLVSVPVAAGDPLGEARELRGRIGLDVEDIDDPGARRYQDRFTSIEGTSYTLEDGVYTVRTGAASYSSTSRTSPSASSARRWSCAGSTARDRRCSRSG